MKTEAGRTFTHGFALTEQELRRTVDTAIQQLQRIDRSQAPSIHIEVKLRNGTVAQSLSIEDVLSFENFGSKRIVGIDIVLKEHGEPVKYQIKVGFTNLSVEGNEDFSVVYKVFGEDRDWVLVTSSELEERIGKVKCFAWNQIFRGSSARYFLPILFLFMLLMTMVGLVVGLSLTLGQRTNIADKMEAGWKTGSLRDPIEALIMMQRNYESQIDVITPVALVRWVAVYPLAFVCTVLLCGILLSYLYPSYVFVWGDYIRVYEKRLAARKIVFYGILLSLAISIIAGIIVTKIHLGN
jgi:hypothetical protein